jgi:hypothetical protein
MLATTILGAGNRQGGNYLVIVLENGAKPL